MTSETKATQTERIRTLNDALRKNFGQGQVVMTTGILRSDPKQSRTSPRPSKSTTTFAMLTIHTKNMTLARSRPMATQSFLRSSITTRALRTFHQMQQTQPSPSASSPSCWPRNTNQRPRGVNGGAD